eukprot:1668137-Pyramimonas_sp.AAC.1
MEQWRGALPTTLSWWTVSTLPFRLSTPCNLRCSPKMNLDMSGTIFRTFKTSAMRYGIDR